MLANKYSVVQSVAKLREHEKLQGQGLTILQACKRLGISEQTCWRVSTTLHAERAFDALGMVIWSGRAAVRRVCGRTPSRFGLLKASQTDWIAV